MDLKDIRQKTIGEINHLIKEKKTELETVIKNIVNDKENNVRKIGQIKKDIARLKTIINEKEDK